MPLTPALLEFARKMRKEQTDAEQLLWRLLRNRNFCGFKFRRQFPIAGYILDFFCAELDLGIELDGGGHADTDQVAYDEERTKVLNGAGIRILRFWNNDLLINSEAVLEEIYRQLMIETEYSPSSGLRPPSPSREKGF